MNGAVQTAAAEALADWCKLGVETFGTIYSEIVAGTTGKPWAVLVVEPSNVPSTIAGKKALFRSACREAQAGDLLIELALRITRAEVTVLGRSQADADAIVGRVVTDASGAQGRMQRLTQNGALLGRETLEGVLAVDGATALVYRGGKVAGTAFLVGPDLVLTSAHVVMSDDGNTFVDRLANDLSFSFLVPAGSTTKDPVTAAPNSVKPLEASSLPWGRPPDRLFMPPDTGSPSCLDYALVRLDRQITHLKPLALDLPPQPERQDDLVVLGFAGGTAMKWGVGKVTAVETERLQHMASTLPGMSGSCCINVHGVPIALHEGSVVQGKFALGGGGPNAGANRAVCLSVIRRAMRANGTDPLLARPRSPGYAILDESLVRTWANAGLRLTQQKAMQEWWREKVKNAIDVFPEHSGSFPAFHPWFLRKPFETWIDSSMQGQSIDRLCVVNGVPGSGKSFLAAILRAKLGNPDADLVVIPTTQTTAWSWNDALTRLGGVPGLERDLRPEPARLRHVEVPDAAKAVASRGGRDPGAQPAPLFVVIDFDGNASFSGDESPWLLFMQELLARPWVRLVTIGAPRTVTSTLVSSAFDEQGAEKYQITEVTLDHISDLEFGRFANQILKQSRARVDPHEFAKAMEIRTKILAAAPPREMFTICSVLAGIVLQRHLEA